MSNYQTELVEKVLVAVEDSIMGTLTRAQVLQGSTKRVRSHMHIFVPGELYGGATGRLLCRKPWVQMRVMPGFIRTNICPECQRRLREMAIIAANSWPQDLLDIAAGTPVAAMLPADITAVLEEINRRSFKQPVERPVQEPLFDPAQELELSRPIAMRRSWDMVA